MRRLALVLALVLAACSYESSGTTTTTVVDPADVPPPTFPADIVVDDQRIEGGAIVVSSVSLPSSGWVVARADDAGTPGEVIGISALLRAGVIASVQLPFFVPIDEPQAVHVSVQIDVDEDGVFSYEPPELVDAIATTGAGSAATVTADIGLLPPLDPADAAINEQRTDGAVVEVSGVTLPAPGFVVVHRTIDGELGEAIAFSELLPTGTTTGIVFTLDSALRTTQVLSVVAYVDRDEDGVFTPEDEPGRRADGSMAAGSATVTVVVVDPAAVTVEDQESSGEDPIVIAEVVLPAPGFVEILNEVDGVPGDSLAVSGLLLAGTIVDLEFSDLPPIDADIALWVRLHVDFDGDGVLSDGDRPALEAPDGSRVEAPFDVSFVEPDEEQDA